MSKTKPLVKDIWPPLFGDDYFGWINGHPVLVPESADLYVAKLLELLGHRKSRLRWMAAEQLGKIGSPEAVQPLTGALSDPHWLVRLHAEKALRHIRASHYNGTHRFAPCGMSPQHPRTTHLAPPGAAYVVPPKPPKPDSHGGRPAVAGGSSLPSVPAAKPSTPELPREGQPAVRPENLSRRTRGATCDHQWIEDFDPDEDAATYNTGLTYLPAFRTCTKCGKRERIRDEPRPDWGFILLFPFILVVVFVFAALAPLIILIAAAYEALFSKRGSPAPDETGRDVR